MASRVLLRLIDEAILPAIVIVVAKVVAVALLVQWLGLGWQFNTDSMIPGVVFDSSDVGLFVNSYSNLFLYFVILVGLGWVLVKAYHFHEEHISPGFVLKLLSLNLTNLLTSTNEVFQQGVVWMAYLWLATLLIVLHAFLGICFWWVAGLCFFLTIIASWLFVADVERELAS